MIEMRKQWTTEEIDYLEKKYEKTSAEFIAKKLGRTVNSVKRKAQNLGLNTYVTEVLRAKTLAKCFNSDVSVVIRWIEKLGLPARVEKHGRLTMYGIDYNKFWNWAKLHQGEIPWYKYERHSVNPEPDWLENAIVRSIDRSKYRTPITERELSVMRALVRSGKSYEEVAKCCGRTYYSVNHLARKKLI